MGLGQGPSEGGYAPRPVPCLCFFGQPGKAGLRALCTAVFSGSSFAFIPREQRKKEPTIQEGETGVGFVMPALGHLHFALKQTVEIIYISA